MIKLENVVLASPEQIEFIIEDMRNPMNSWEKSDSGECNPIDRCYYSCNKVGCVDAVSLQRRYRTSEVYVRVTAPLYWWKDFDDTYKVGTDANSCSTMHKIQEKEFTIEDFSCEHLSDITMEGFKKQIEYLEDLRTAYILTKDGNKCAGMSREDLWWQMIQLLPSSYNQTRNVMMNYEVLANIYKSRKNHKLDEWRELCKWIESLPYGELITGKEIAYEKETH